MATRKHKGHAGPPIEVPGAEYAAPKPVGRPCVYNRQQADYICQELSKGRYLRQICEEESMPWAATVRDWVDRDDDGFRERYTRAKLRGLEEMVERIQYSSELPMPGQTEEITEEWDEAKDADGNTIPVKIIKRKITVNDNVARSRLIADNLKWYACKMAPKIYGDKVAVEVNDVTDIEAELRAGRERVRAMRDKGKA